MRWLARCDSCIRAGGPHIPRPPDPATRPATPPSRGQYRPPSPDDIARDAAIQAELDEAMWQRQWERWQARVPERFRDATVDDPLVDPENAQIVRDRIGRLRAGRPAGLLLTGHPGGGKSWLGWALVNAAVRDRILFPAQIRAGREDDLFASITTADLRDVNRLWQEALHPRVRLVFIDDLGRGGYLTAPRRDEVYDRVLDFVWSGNRTLIVTTNMGGEELRKTLGPATYDRLKAAVALQPVVVGDRQMRTRLAQTESRPRAADAR